MLISHMYAMIYTIIIHMSCNILKYKPVELLNLEYVQQ